MSGTPPPPGKGTGGIYVHVPFCSAICPYCDFAVLMGDADARARYVETLLAELATVDPDDWSCDTLYLGGGTPSALDPGQLERLLGAITARLGAPLHITMEANPEDVSAASVDAWRDLGVAMLSLGVQSLDDGELRFSNDSYRAGARPLSASFSWGVSVADWNNDGSDDIFVAASRDRWIFMNNGHGGFVAHSSPEPTIGIGDGYQDLSGAPRIGGKGTAAADYDRDGDVDIVIWRDHDSVLLLENVSPNDNHWLRVRLEGTTSNASAIGALVVIHGLDGWSHRKQVIGGQSQQSQAERVLHFGLGQRAALDRLEIHWPGAMCRWWSPRG